MIIFCVFAFVEQIMRVVEEKMRRRNLKRQGCSKLEFCNVGKLIHTVSLTIV